MTLSNPFLLALVLLCVFYTVADVALSVLVAIRAWRSGFLHRIGRRIAPNW